MFYIFLTVWMISLIYFILKKRTFDFYSTAFFSASIYFLPGFFRYTLYPTTNNEFMKYPLLPETYLVMIMVLVSITVGAALSDRKSLAPTALVAEDVDRIGALIMISIAITGFLITIHSLGGLLFSPDKSVSSEVLMRSRTFIFWEIGGILAAILTFLTKRWICFSVIVLILIFELYIGYRAGVGLAMIGLMTVWLSQKGRQRFIFKNRVFSVLIVVLISAALFAQKMVYIAVKQGVWQLVFSMLSSPDFYLQAISESEPFVTQTVLNEVLGSSFHVGFEHFKYLFYQIILFSPELGLSTVSFNDLFQSALFHYVRWGMDSNIWAEIWSAGGWLFLFVFLVFFSYLLAIGSFILIKKSGLIIKSAFIASFSYIAFYLHRSSLTYSINIQKRIWLIAAFVFILAHFIAAILGKRTRPIHS